MKDCWKTLSSISTSIDAVSSFVISSFIFQCNFTGSLPVMLLVRVTEFVGTALEKAIHAQQDHEE